jgi:UDP-N-acetylmuramoyl-L-alanyl-D-glutamate--2,6-diaminopimelate ligase
VEVSARVTPLGREGVSRVLAAEPPAGSLANGEITAVTHDSRDAGPGVAFVAVPGFRRDGAEFVPEALERGAELAVAEREVPGFPVAVVPDARAALAALACAVYGEPSQELAVYGVTGTNGKTTTSYALYSILASEGPGEETGLLTTAETVCGGERVDAVRTTPEAVEVQRLLAMMRDSGSRRAVMEVSSHGVALKRVSGVRFAGALFTNLTRDHLDLHGTMEEYYRAKRELFYRVVDGGPKLANADDEHGRRLSREVDGVSTFGAAPDADYRVENVRAGAGGTAFTLRREDEAALELQTPLLGGYNVMNVAGAASFALAAGVGEAEVGRAVARMPQVPGRFERVTALSGAEPEFEVIVDYAHTDVGLEAALGVAREVASRERNGGTGGERGRVICVFGAAGDRDGAKRPLMGQVAASLSDVAIITTDDAYSEDPEKIAREVGDGVGTGVESGTACEVILDRREAIHRALDCARPGDVVLVAGKGHERVQHLPEGDVPFHDATVAGELLGELRQGASSAGNVTDNSVGRAG